MQSTSSESPPDSTIIRTGGDGRLRYSPQLRRGMYTAFERSGQNAMAICRQHGVAYQTFIAWLRKERSGSSQQNPSIHRWGISQAQPFRSILLPTWSHVC